MSDLDALKLEEVQFLPYQLKKHQVNYDTYIFLGFNAKGFEYALRDYGGVAIPTKNLIMVFGSEEDLDIKNYGN